MNENKKEKSDWIRLASKSRPGRFYLFNKTTGETQWLPLKQQDSVQLKRGPTLPKLSIEKVSKTPAQDRLKRLQHNLKVDQTKKHTSSTAHHGSIFSIKASKEQEIVLDEQPTSSSISQNFKKSRKKARKRKSVISSNETDNNSHSSVIDNPKKLRVSDTLKCDLTKAATSNESSSLKNSVEISQSTKDSSINIPENSQNGSSKLENLRSGIVKTIQKICKIPYNVSKILTTDKLLTQNENSSNLKNIKKSKATRKTKSRQILSKSDTPEVAISQIKAENQFLKKASDTNLPKNLKYPSYPQGSANSRLDRLRQSLLSQNHGKQEPCNDRNNSDSKCQGSNLMAEPKRNETSSLQIGDTRITENNSTISAHSSDNVTNSDEGEAMDWQPILMTEGSIEEAISQPTLIVEKSKRFLLKEIDVNENQTMGDIIDTVNENLLRFAAEKEKASNNNNKKWRKDFYYFVVDTNVLLRDITFLEDLSKVKLCGTKGSMLYIPYTVLQELDKLKMRSGASEGVKTLAVRAIKYLNSKFENNSHHLQAQSALAEQRHLIDINSADDSIINCCLQVMEHVGQLLLLTEDVNLRNKAICNNITVSTKSDLVTKRYEKSDKS